MIVAEAPNAQRSARGRAAAALGPVRRPRPPTLLTLTKHAPWLRPVVSARSPPRPRKLPAKRAAEPAGERRS